MATRGEAFGINAMLSTPLGPGAAPVMLYQEGRGRGGVAEILYLLASRCHHPHRLTAWLARHHQSLNYLTDVSLAPAADPVAERQRGAEEHGAKWGGGWHRRLQRITFSCAVRVAALSTGTQPLITLQSFSVCSR